jgi:hypothetical protein
MTNASADGLEEPRDAHGGVPKEAAVRPRLIDNAGQGGG